VAMLDWFILRREGLQHGEGGSRVPEKKEKKKTQLIIY